MLRRFILASGIGLSLAQAALAGDLVDKAGEAEVALEAGKSREAVLLMREL
jgi:hypothetical protein